MRLRERFSQMSIKWRVFALLAGFIAVTLAILWLFQIVLLDWFYKSIKMNDIKSSAQSISKNIDSAELPSLLESIARDSQMCIVVSNDLGQVLGSVEAQPSCVIHRLNTLSRRIVYQVTVDNGGSYFEKFLRDDFQVVREEIVSDHHMAQGGRMRDEPESIVYTFLAERKNGSRVMVMLNSTISPVNATVQTLRIQLLWITGILLVIALGLAFYLSRRIVKPIVSISESAKKLARGDYTQDFETGGYREVAELGQTLNYTASELSKVETLRRDLIANVSHDLRTPLTMITGYSEVMRDLPGENTPENVQVVIDEANRLTTLVNDMLDLSKLQAGHMTLSRSVFNLTEAVRQILTRYNKLTDYHISFHADFDVWVNADAVKISQVVYNLVNNALTYTGEDKAVRLWQGVQGETAHVSVSDTGAGIPQDKLKDIWERYYKLDKSHKRAQVGTGLGLSIVKTVLDMHGGRYGVQSQEGQGSTFWFELDIVPPPEKP